MLGIHCRGNHGKRADLCGDCSRLREYALKRLETCPYGEDKPACSHCPVHCYKADMREGIREAMRYAGPRMLARHPILALLHMLDLEKKSPEAAPLEKE
jgi:hypothetical protein